MDLDNELGTQMVRRRHQLHQFSETGFNGLSIKPVPVHESGSTPV